MAYVITTKSKDGVRTKAKHEKDLGIAKRTAKAWIIETGGSAEIHADTDYTNPVITDEQLRKEI